MSTHLYVYTGEIQRIPSTLQPVERSVLSGNSRSQEKLGSDLSVFEYQSHPLLPTKTYLTQSLGKVQMLIEDDEDLFFLTQGRQDAQVQSLIQTVTSPTDPFLVEREILRSQQYTEILKWLAQRIPRLRYKEVSSLLLRYRFNQIAGPNDDPVFVTSSFDLADAQFRQDWSYFKLPGNPNPVLLELHHRLQTAAEVINSTSLPLDQPVRLEEGFLLYNKYRFPDLGKLGEIDPSAALALHLRYSTIQLGTQGLSKDYTGPKDSATEAFGGAFNHYYSRYFSLFPDLEARFGSQGSFFNATKFETSLVYVNPPFDAGLMLRAVQKILLLIEEGAPNQFIFVLPDWRNFPALDLLLASPWKQKVVSYPRGSLEFIDKMTQARVFPCDIVEVTVHR